MVQSYFWLEDVIQNQLINLDCGQIRLNQMLMDLLMYDSKDLNNQSFQIFNLIFSERIRLLHILQQISLIDTKDKVAMMNNMINLSLNFVRLSEMTEIWLDPVNSLISNERDYYDGEDNDNN